MKEIRFEMMRPDEISAEQQKSPYIFLPLSPLEWHGPHLPFGFDGLNAYNMALEVAKRVGGVVLPCMYIGAASVVSPEKLKYIGFKGTEYIKGRDYPRNMKSFYFNQEVFAIVLRNYLELLENRNYKAVIIVSTHGEKDHNDVIERLCEEFTKEKELKVLAVRAMNKDEKRYPYKYKSDNKILAEKYAGQPGHSGKAETSLAMLYFPSRVDLDQLPPRHVKLQNTRWSITDAATTNGNPTSNFTVREEEDPREATPEEGQRIFEEAVTQIIEQVEGFFASIGLK